VASLKVVRERMLGGICPGLVDMVEGMLQAWVETMQKAFWKRGGGTGARWETSSGDLGGN